MKKTTINFYLDGCTGDQKKLDHLRDQKGLRGEEKKKRVEMLTKLRSIFLYIRVPNATKPIKVYTGWKAGQQHWMGDNVATSEAVTYNRISELYIWFDEETRPGSESIITKEKVENIIDKINGKPERNKLLTEFVPWVENFIKTCNKAKNTRASYQGTLNHLVTYAKKKKIELTWNIFNMDFYHSFMEYLYECGLIDSTTGKVIQDLKSFLNKAFDEDKHTNLNFKKKSFKALASESDGIALTPDEILKIYNVDLSGTRGLQRKLLEDAKNIFVLNCWIGLRIHDLIKLGPHYIRVIPGGTAIAITTAKTHEDVVIPLNKIAAEIYEKHGATLFLKKFHLAQYNNRLRELAKITGFTNLIQDRTTVRGVTTFNFIPKFEMMSAHVARRSFATNCYKMGIPVKTIMAVTGHTTEESFMRYIKVSKDEHAQIMLEHFNRPESEPALKIA